MQPLASKKTRFDSTIEPPKTPTLVKLFLPKLRSLGLSSVSSFFPSSSLFIAQLTNLFFSLFCFPLRIPADHQESRPIAKQSSLIRSESLLNLLLAACQRAEEEAEAKKRGNSFFWIVLIEKK